MTIQLSADQIARYWDALKWVVAGAVDEPVDSNTLLGLLLAGKAQCWVSLNEERRIGLVGVTMLTSSQLSGEKDLLLYALVAQRRVPREEWEDAVRVLRAWAKKQGCRRVVAYSTLESVRNMVEKELGGGCVYFLTIPVEGGE